MPNLSPTAGRAPSYCPIQQTSSAISVAPATSDPASATVGTSVVGNEEGAHISEGVTTTDEGKTKDFKPDRKGGSAVAAAPAPGGEEKVRKPEPLDNATPTSATEATEAETIATALETPTKVEAEPVVAAAQATATAPEDEVQAREKEECEKLVNMRAEKILLIKGN